MVNQHYLTNVLNGYLADEVAATYGVMQNLERENNELTERIEMLENTIYEHQVREHRYITDRALLFRNVGLVQNAQNETYDLWMQERQFSDECINLIQQLRGQLTTIHNYVMRDNFNKQVLRTLTMLSRRRTLNRPVPKRIFRMQRLARQMPIDDYIRLLRDVHERGQLIEEPETDSETETEHEI